MTTSAKKSVGTDRPALMPGGLTQTKGNRGAAREGSTARNNRDPPSGGSVAGWTRTVDVCSGIYEYGDRGTASIHARGATATAVDQDKKDIGCPRQSRCV